MYYSSEDVQDSWTANYKLQNIAKTNGEDINKWRDILCSWMRRSCIVKMSFISTLIQRFNIIPTKIPTGFFWVEIVKPVPKFRLKGIRLVKTIWKKNSKVGKLTFLNFKSKYKSIVIKTVGIDIRIDKQINGTEFRFQIKI